MSARQKQWYLQQPATPEFTEQLGRGAILTTLLHQRGQRELEQAYQFLDATYPNGLHNPLLMHGMAPATTRIAHAITNQEPIAVYGDFDTDGVTAVALLQQAITAMGGSIRPYIPHRETEGYGLNTGAIDDLAAEGTRLLVTVDCGISNVQEVAHARSLGLDVIVTDHHTPPATLPDALAIVNPKQPACAYPYQQLVGVGIAFKLVQALVKQGLPTHGLRGRDMLDLVALGTIADLGPLDGENRILVKAGLDAIRLTQRPGLQALIKAAGLRQERIDSTAIAFMLAPRINAAGRIQDASLAYHLLLAEDSTTAATLAEELNQANRQRQQLTEEMYQAAREHAERENKHTNPIVLLHNQNYRQGLVGLVAAKLAEAWHRPVLMIERGDDESRGSARSVNGFNIIETLTICKDLFTRFGGHSMAAGFTIPTSRMDELEERLLAIATTTITDTMLSPRLTLDADIPLHDITWETLSQIQQLEPFGNGNSQPTLLSRNVEAIDIQTVGKQHQHLKLRLRANGSRPLDAIAFRLGHLAEPLRKHPHIDIAYTLETNEWQEYHSLQLNLKDFQQAGKEIHKGG
jgi:single-stranded-DNA-specific exonuclease